MGPTMNRFSRPEAFWGVIIHFGKGTTIHREYLKECVYMTMNGEHMTAMEG